MHPSDKKQHFSQFSFKSPSAKSNKYNKSMSKSQHSIYSHDSSAQSQNKTSKIRKMMTSDPYNKVFNKLINLNDLRQFVKQSSQYVQFHQQQVRKYIPSTQNNKARFSFSLKSSSLVCSYLVKDYRFLRHYLVLLQKEYPQMRDKFREDIYERYKDEVINRDRFDYYFKQDNNEKKSRKSVTKSVYKVKSVKKVQTNNNKKVRSVKSRQKQQKQNKVLNTTQIGSRSPIKTRSYKREKQQENMRQKLSKQRQTLNNNNDLIRKQEQLINNNNVQQNKYSKQIEGNSRQVLIKSSSNKSFGVRRRTTQQNLQLIQQTLHEIQSMGLLSSPQIIRRQTTGKQFNININNSKQIQNNQNISSNNINQFNQYVNEYKCQQINQSNINIISNTKKSFTKTINQLNNNNINKSINNNKYKHNNNPTNKKSIPKSQLSSQQHTNQYQSQHQLPKQQLTSLSIHSNQSSPSLLNDDFIYDNLFAKQSKYKSKSKKKNTQQQSQNQSQSKPQKSTHKNKSKLNSSYQKQIKTIKFSDLYDINDPKHKQIVQMMNKIQQKSIQQNNTKSIQQHKNQQIQKSIAFRVSQWRKQVKHSFTQKQKQSLPQQIKSIVNLFPQINYIGNYKHFTYDKNCFIYILLGECNGYQVEQILCWPTRDLDDEVFKCLYLKQINNKNQTNSQQKELQQLKNNLIKHKIQGITLLIIQKQEQTIQDSQKK